ncbi:MAG: hypothetical protein AAF335_03340 [Bacteroidota bacterium]
MKKISSLSSLSVAFLSVNLLLAPYVLHASNSQVVIKNENQASHYSHYLPFLEDQNFNPSSHQRERQIDQHSLDSFNNQLSQPGLANHNPANESKDNKRIKKKVFRKFNKNFSKEERDLLIRELRDDIASTNTEYESQNESQKEVQFSDHANAGLNSTISNISSNASLSTAGESNLNIVPYFSNTSTHPPAQSSKAINRLSRKRKIDDQRENPLPKKKPKSSLQVTQQKMPVSVPSMMNNSSYSHYSHDTYEYQQYMSAYMNAHFSYLAMRSSYNAARQNNTVAPFPIQPFVKPYTEKGDVEYHPHHTNYHSEEPSPKNTPKVIDLCGSDDEMSTSDNLKSPPLLPNPTNHHLQHPNQDHTHDERMHQNLLQLKKEAKNEGHTERHPLYANRSSNRNPSNRLRNHNAQHRDEEDSQQEESDSCTDDQAHTSHKSQNCDNQIHKLLPSLIPPKKKRKSRNSKSHQEKIFNCGNKKCKVQNFDTITKLVDHLATNRHRGSKGDIWTCLYSECDTWKEAGGSKGAIMTHVKVKHLEDIKKSTKGKFYLADYFDYKKSVKVSINKQLLHLNLQPYF